jgi:hypothetical protein
MKHSLGNFGVSVVLAVISSLALVSWMLNDDLSSTITEMSQSELTHPGITRFKFEFVDQRILLKVDLAKPMSCSEVFTVLGVEDLFIKGKVYSPVCTLVKPKYVVITYREVKTA